MLTQLSRHWWWLALRGISAILFGTIALGWHGTTLRSFMLLFGSLALVDGLLAGFAALTIFAGGIRWWILLHGLVSVAISVFALIWTESTASIFFYLVIAWALITGIFELVGAKRLDRDISNERLLRWSGIASIIFAVLVIRFHFLKTDVISLAGMIVAIAIILGMLTMAMSLNIRSLGKYIHTVRLPVAGLTPTHNGSFFDYIQSSSYVRGEQKTEKMLTAIFNTAPQALKGVYCLKDLHRAGEIILHTTAVIAKDATGVISIKQATARELHDTPLGFLSGILLGTLGGPIGFFIGGYIGGLAGLIFDLAKTGVSVDFLEEVSLTLDPGKAALLAELDEASASPVDKKLVDLGGHVFRYQRYEFVEDQMINELDNIALS